MEALRIFNNPRFGTIRTAIINDQPFFVANDIAKILGYSYPVNAIQDHVDDDDKQLVQLSDIQDVDKMPHLKGSRITIINESGVYSLVFGSKLEGAKQFKKWVTSEVLPSIRKNGMYATDYTIENMLSNPENAIKVFTALKEERTKRQLAEQTVKEQEPKVLFANSVAGSNNSVLVKDLATILRQNGIEIGQNRLYEWLRENGYLLTKGEYYNRPSQKALEMELFEVIVRTNQNAIKGSFETFTTKVTGKGQIYFVNKFLKHGNSNA